MQRNWYIIIISAQSSAIYYVSVSLQHVRRMKSSNETNSTWIRTRNQEYQYSTKSIISWRGTWPSTYKINVTVPTWKGVRVDTWWTCQKWRTSMKRNVIEWNLTWDLIEAIEDLSWQQKQGLDLTWGQEADTITQPSLFKEGIKKLKTVQ